MKKVILSLIGLALSASAVMAQTNSVRANNGPTPSIEGYSYNFGGTNANNCRGGVGIENYNPADITNQSWSVDGEGHLVVSVPDTMTVYNDQRQIMKFYEGDGGPTDLTPIDLSTVANQKFKIKLTSPMAGEMAVVFVRTAEEQSNFGSTSPIPVYALVAGENIIEEDDIDLTGISDPSDIDALGLMFRTTWGNSSFNGDVVIDYIQIGDAVGTTLSPKLSITDEADGTFPNPYTLEVSSALAGEVSSADTIKLKNTGPKKLTVTSMVLSGTNASEFLIPAALTEVIEAGVDSSFYVKFSPSAGSTEGDTKSAVLTITTDDVDNPSWVINLTATVEEEVSTGTTVSVNNSLISVYPNPAKDQINLDLSSLNSNNALVKVMNANGMLVYEAQVSTSNTVINSSSFNKGMYLVQVSSGNKISNQKIVIE